MVKALLGSLFLLSAQAAQFPILKNDKVAVTEYRLMPSETAHIAAGASVRDRLLRRPCRVQRSRLDSDPQYLARRDGALRRSDVSGRWFK